MLGGVSVPLHGYPEDGGCSSDAETNWKGHSDDSGQPKQISNTIHYLWVWLNGKLSFQKHISQRADKAS